MNKLMNQRLINESSPDLGRTMDYLKNAIGLKRTVMSNASAIEEEPKYVECLGWETL